MAHAGRCHHRQASHAGARRDLEFAGENRC